MNKPLFLVAAGSQLQFIAGLQLHDNDVNCISFAPGRASCNVRPDCFVRLARQFGIEKLKFSQWGRDQPRFVHQGVEFVCVCNGQKLAAIAEEFEMVCTDSHLQEAGY